MCILFAYRGDNDADSEYQLILAENRDTYYDRLASNMAVWEDPTIIGGRDLEATDSDGTWLAVSPQRRKLGVLLSLPHKIRTEAKSRGRIVTEYVQSNCSAKDYVSTKKKYFEETNGFVFVAVEFGSKTQVQTYASTTDKLLTWKESCVGFSNSLPEKPLTKVENGKKVLKDICGRLNKVNLKEQLIDELLKLLQLKGAHLPDPQLENRTPKYEQHSSIFITIPEDRYGTRTHTIMLLTKSGQLDLIEISLQDPVDLENPIWKRTEYHTNIKGVEA